MVFFAIRYGFGLDYWSYYDLFTNEIHSRTHGPEEPLFYSFMWLFPKYYIFVIAHTAFLFICLYYISYKNIASEYYYLLFFLLLFNPDMILNMTSAMRSSMAACVIWVFTYLFLIKKTNILLYEIGVLVATGFHTSAAFLAVLPIALYLIKLVQGRTLFIVLMILNVLSMFWPTSLYDWFIGYSGLEIYNSYTIYISSFMGFLFKMLLAPVAFHICTAPTGYDMNPRVRQLSIFFLALVFANFDFHGRFTVYLNIFFIAAVCALFANANKTMRIVISSTMVLYLLYNFYTLITVLASDIYRLHEGNPLIYETIFDVATKP